MQSYREYKRNELFCVLIVPKSIKQAITCQIPEESGTRKINMGETVQLDTDVVGPFGHLSEKKIRYGKTWKNNRNVEGLNGIDL